MSIPGTQFETWSKQGATASATAIYDRIKRALKTDSRLLSRDFEVFLQGSYRNSTNIHGDSDVDVVVKLNQTYMPDYTGVDESTKRLIESRTVPATYAFADFRKDVSAAIRAAFPNHDVTEGGKSIKIPRTSNNIPADVVPSLSYRQYFPGLGLNPERNFIDGIWLKDVKRGGTVVSFPRQHYDNGVSKQSETRSWYKPTVRILKNARGRLKDRRIIAEGAASSHSIECLLYNVPSQLFGSTYQDTFVEVVNWLADADMNQFVCQNGVQKLFAPGRWTTEDARSFVLGLIELWNQWSQDPAALSAGAVYGFFVLVFDRWIWRLVPTIPDLTGTWVGTIASSHPGGTSTECVMRVRQTWTRMAITLETEKSTSRTTMAALFTDQPGDNGLKYEFISEPKHRAVETMHPHRGVCMLQLGPARDKLRGDYFTGRSRQTHGEITIARVSREQLEFDAAMEAKQQ